MHAYVLVYFNVVFHNFIFVLTLQIIDFTFVLVVFCSFFEYDKGYNLKVWMHIPYLHIVLLKCLKGLDKYVSNIIGGHLLRTLLNLIILIMACFTSVGGAGLFRCDLQYNFLNQQKKAEIRCKQCFPSVIRRGTYWDHPKQRRDVCDAYNDTFWAECYSLLSQWGTNILWGREEGDTHRYSDPEQTLVSRISDWAAV